MEHKEAHEKIKSLKANLSKVIKGKDEVLDLTIACLISEGHLLIEDVPGVGKTTLAHGLAKSIACTFQRIQFTSDLLPSDVIGVTVYNQAEHAFEFRKGPIFANIVLADEINRASPKTQSALLEAMNDRQVSVDKFTYPLPEPFMLLATQNPLEFSGTFPLPESQLDRFTMCIRIGYPDEADERRIVQSAPSAVVIKDLSPALNAGDVLKMQSLAGTVRVDEDLVSYMLSIASKTRSHKGIRLGVSPRGTMTLYKTAQAFALVNNRDYVTPDDIKALAVPVFAHRVILESEGVREDTASASLFIEEILSQTAVPI
ncbi:MAG: MoxR family ATPase [Deltaproteobacteria bacterium]|nr:MoxR family ATPase [Deltaproteobacteria bacterium]